MKYYYNITERLSQEWIAQFLTEFGAQLLRRQEKGNRICKFLKIVIRMNRNRHNHMSGRREKTEQMDLSTRLKYALFSQGYFSNEIISVSPLGSTELPVSMAGGEEMNFIKTRAFLFMSTCVSLVSSNRHREILENRIELIVSFRKTRILKRFLYGPRSLMVS